MLCGKASIIRTDRDRGRRRSVDNLSTIKINTQLT